MIGSRPLDKGVTRNATPRRGYSVLPLINFQIKYNFSPNNDFHLNKV